MPDSLSSFFKELLTGEEGKQLMREDRNSRMNAAGVDMRPRIGGVSKWDKIKDLVFGRAENVLGDGPVSMAANMATGDLNPENAGNANAITAPFGRKVVPLAALDDMLRNVKSPKVRDALEGYAATQRNFPYASLPGKISHLTEIPGTVRPKANTDLGGFVEATAKQFPDVDPQLYTAAIAPQTHWTLGGAQGTFHSTPLMDAMGVTYVNAPQIHVGSGLKDAANTGLHESTHGFQTKANLINKYRSATPWQFKPHEIQAVGRMLPENVIPNTLEDILAEPDRDPLTEILTGIYANRKSGPSWLRTSPTRVVKDETIPLNSYSDAFLHTQLPTINLNLARQGSPRGIEIKLGKGESFVQPREFPEMKIRQDELKKADLEEFTSILQEILRLHGTLR